MPLLREDQAFIQVQLGGVNKLDANDVAVSLPNLPAGWTSLEGGDIEAEDVFTRPGGMRPGINLGGPTKRTDCTVQVQYSTDFDRIIQTIETLAGNRSMAVSWTPLDADGNVNGNTNTITGVLKNVTRPNFNANASGATFLSLVMACNT